MDAGGFIETYRGGVAAWECDVFGHLNIAFYVERLADAAADLLERQAPGRRWRTQVALDTSYERELRAGEGIVIRSAILAATPDQVRVVHEAVESASARPRHASRACPGAFATAGTGTRDRARGLGAVSCVPLAGGRRPDRRRARPGEGTAPSPACSQFRASSSSTTPARKPRSPSRSTRPRDSRRASRAAKQHLAENRPLLDADRRALRRPAALHRGALGHRKPITAGRPVVPGGRRARDARL